MVEAVGRGVSCLALLRVTLRSANLLQVILSGVIYGFPESGSKFASFWVEGCVDNGVCLSLMSRSCMYTKCIPTFDRAPEGRRRKKHEKRKIRNNKEAVVWWSCWYCTNTTTRQNV